MLSFMSASLILYSSFRFVRKGEIRHGRPYSAIVLTYFFELIVVQALRTCASLAAVCSLTNTSSESRGGSCQNWNLGPKEDSLVSLSGATFVRITCGALDMLIMGAALDLVHQCLWK